MTWLILGLVLFLGTHSVRVFAESWRTRVHAQVGENAYKGLYSVLSIAGFVLLIWGYGQARAEPVLLWIPPVGLRHLAALLTLLAFILLAAAYVPGNHFKAWVHHPMVLGVKTWAFAHLLANGLLAPVILFGAFFLWAVLNFRAARQRDRQTGQTYPPGRIVPTLITLAVGCAAWAGFAFWAHGAWIGPRPFN